jgi:hypothetical protein
MEFYAIFFIPSLEIGPRQSTSRSLLNVLLPTRVWLCHFLADQFVQVRLERVGESCGQMKMGEGNIRREERE